jgi:hypothetical protein
MPAAVIPIRQQSAKARTGFWSLLELAPAHAKPRPLGILFVDEVSDRLIPRILDSSTFEDLDEHETDIVDHLPGDFSRKSSEAGASAFLASLEHSLSHFLRIGDRKTVQYTGDPGRAADRLFDEYVDGEVRPFVTHLPLYGLRAAATKFGESMESSLEEWIRIPAGTRLTDNMFVAQVVGRSMEPLIPDGSFCIFRAGVAGSRQGKRLLIEQFSETDFAARYTVKRYTSRKSFDPEGEFTGHEQIRLEPLNSEFEAFDLGPDEFRVIAELVGVLDS